MPLVTFALIFFSAPLKFKVATVPKSGLPPEFKYHGLRNLPAIIHGEEVRIWLGFIQPFFFMLTNFAGHRHCRRNCGLHRVRVSDARPLRRLQPRHRPPHQKPLLQVLLLHQGPCHHDMKMTRIEWIHDGFMTFRLYRKTRPPSTPSCGASTSTSVTPESGTGFSSEITSRTWHGPCKITEQNVQFYHILMRNKG